MVQVYAYADRRCAGYEAVGYSILLPASALPVDAQWKQDYAASVRRLIRDGVDQPLAQLFVHAARPASTDTQGIERARSASEAFFYRRLESMAATRGLFKLNASLPIPFDDSSQMKVDFLCLDTRLVIEIDGMQHLSTPESWRRDRRKDVLLQFQDFSSFASSPTI